MTAIDNELEFTFLETSLAATGLTAVECNKDFKKLTSVPKTLLPIGLPPVVKSHPQEVKARFLRCLEDESVYSRTASPRFFARVVDNSELFSMDLCRLKTSIQVERNPTNGQLLGFYEAEEICEGGVEKKRVVQQETSGKAEVDRFLEEDFCTPGMFKTDLLTQPPGFKSGMEFDANAGTNVSATSFNVTDLLFNQDFDDQFGLEQEIQETELQVVDGSSNEDPALEKELEITNTKPVALSQPDKAKPDEDKLKTNPLEETWAVEINVNTAVTNFHKVVPNMAHKYPFQLDTFQEHAVIKLEKQESVFVAAHTSAGKTVVAEYAIALTAKHMTRVIYTSPIKALSNQKFRDFKQTFTDVGLITGDVQINPEAFCLIMTTEILRSMLYNGSDVIRDLEWVIFDEVHYINDAERGVVWEEVLITLPQHCNIILLSATVPNAFEFANWIGRTRQRKIYVISTLKRPVPLEHYLYTGNSNKTSNELFLLVDGDRKFLKQGHKSAMDAKSARASKHSKTFGAKHRTGGGYNADKNVWLSLITRLRKTDQLPVVGFTFSRRRCDENAGALESLDLTSTSEKREIKNFFNKCIQRLKGTDRKLPQVLRMAALLEKGLGVHHSGILPILKEVVEMLFSKGLVKLLFATETFAMGVNMPARTVVFDSLRKHDGTQMRNLQPGEYVQMAGRAGRRGLDATGTVILLCKGDVPEMSELHTMMLGSVTKLQSQFRLTYGMILNLLRVEQLRVEEVMRKSFSEFHTRKNSKAQEEELKKLKENLDDHADIESLLNQSDYEQYYLCCKDLRQSRARIMEGITSGNIATKVLQPGRIIVLDTPKYRRHVAVYLKTNASRAEKSFIVLVLRDGARDYVTEDHNVWGKNHVLRKEVFRSEGEVTQELLEVRSDDISHITVHSFKLHPDTIIADCKRRAIPRFRSDPPDHSTAAATQQMIRLIDSHPDGLQEINVISELGLKQLELVEDVAKIRSLETSISEVFECVERPRFESQMLEVADYLRLKERFVNLQHLLSDESLFLLPEYKQRVKVLQRLRYVDDNCAVQMKGRVACEISNHELVLTELVFENVLSSLDPAEIVALLSCCVFQQKVDMEGVSLTHSLKEGKSRIIGVAEMIGSTQIECGMRQPVDDFVDVLKFGLVEAVYEWARGTTFKDITSLTDVQEGVVVRTIQRLNELCRDVRNAARVIGDPTLYAKMEKCSELVKRDIVFAASLYTQ